MSSMKKRIKDINTQLKKKGIVIRKSTVRKRCHLRIEVEHLETGKTGSFDFSCSPSCPRSVKNLASCIKNKLIEGRYES